MKLFQIYERRYSWDPFQFRLWRIRFYLDFWELRGGWSLGLTVFPRGLAVDLLLMRATLLLWSHHDDCDCDRCLPF